MDPELLRTLNAEIHNLAYLFYGYAAIWIIIVGYVFWLSRREENLRDEIEELKKAVRERRDR